jgi:hypothetical protein
MSVGFSEVEEMNDEGNVSLRSHLRASVSAEPKL